MRSAAPPEATAPIREAITRAQNERDSLVTEIPHLRCLAADAHLRGDQTHPELETTQVRIAQLADILVGLRVREAQVELAAIDPRMTELQASLSTFDDRLRYLDKRLVAVKESRAISPDERVDLESKIITERWGENSDHDSNKRELERLVARRSKLEQVVTSGLSPVNNDDEA